MNFNSIIKQVAQLQATIEGQAVKNLDRFIKQGALISQAKELNKELPKDSRLSRDEFSELFGFGKSHISDLIKVHKEREQLGAYTDGLKDGDSATLSGFIAFLRGAKEDKPKALLTVTRAKDEDGENGATMRYMDNGEFKINGSTELLEEVLFLCQKELDSRKATSVEIELIEKVVA